MKILVWVVVNVQNIWKIIVSRYFTVFLKESVLGDFVYLFVVMVLLKYFPKIFSLSLFFS